MTCKRARRCFVRFLYIRLPKPIVWAVFFVFEWDSVWKKGALGALPGCENKVPTFNTVSGAVCKAGT